MEIAKDATADILPGGSSVDEKIDQLEAMMLANFPPINCPLTHRFTPGLYTREIFMPAGSLITSKIHNTEHPYVISKGVVSVFTDEDGEVLLKAPHCGITKPGTRRVLYIHEDCVWLTFHPCVDGETVEAIEKRIIEPHNNAFLGVNELKQ